MQLVNPSNATINQLCAPLASRTFVGTAAKGLSKNDYDRVNGFLVYFKKGLDSKAIEHS
jgi:hypothetical protein